MSDPVDLSEFVSAYVAEVEEHLAAANAGLLAVEASLRQRTANPRAVRDLFRVLHTIKGLSAMVGIEPVVAVAHRMETALRASDRSGGKLSATAVDVLLQGVRAIEQRVRAVADGHPVPPPPKSLLDAFEALEAPAEAPAAATTTSLALDPTLVARLAPFEHEQLVQGVREGRRAVRIDFAPSPARAEKGFTISSVRERITALGELVKVLPLTVPVSEKAPGGLTFALLALTASDDAALANAAGLGPDAVQTLATAAPEIHEPAIEPESDEDFTGTRRNMLRVDVQRLDDAMESLSALIVTRSRLSRVAGDLSARGIDVRALQQVIGEHTRQLRDLRAAILRVRMVPVADLLERVPLVVRGLRRASGKSVRLEVDHGNAELDKSVAEQIFPVIVHLVRNAVDHGIESPEERRAAGKPEEGTLRIASSAHSNTRLELTVSDDGRGVDAVAVAQRARRPVPATDSELLDLLCLPGLSTRDEVTATSGRGMGMDIVRKVTVEQLGGDLVLRTEPGRGTTFVLRVPLTVSIIDAFTLECASQRYAVAVESVEEIVEIDPARIAQPPAMGTRGARTTVGMIERRGTAMPLVSLASLLGRTSAPDGERRALVVRRQGELVAFAIDRMLGQQEAVVRPLGDPLVRVPGVAGATDLGDGRPTLVLDLISLSGLVRADRTAQERTP